MIFSGGMPYDQASRTPCITVVYGKTTTVLEMEHNVIDFITLCESPYTSGECYPHTRAGSISERSRIKWFPFRATRALRNNSPSTERPGGHGPPNTGFSLPGEPLSHGYPRIASDMLQLLGGLSSRSHSSFLLSGKGGSHEEAGVLGNVLADRWRDLACAGLHIRGSDHDGVSWTKLD